MLQKAPRKASSAAHHEAETRLIADYARQRRRVEPHILLLANIQRSPLVALADLQGISSYVALHHRKLREALKGRRVDPLVLSPLAGVVIGTALGAGSTAVVPYLWRVPLHVVESYVALFQKEEVVQEMYRFIRESIQEDVLEAAHAGATFLRKVCDGTIDSPVAVRAKYSSLALARVGFGPIQKSMAALGGHLTAEDIEELKLRAREARFEYAEAATLLEPLETKVIREGSAHE